MKQFLVLIALFSQNALSQEINWNKYDDAIKGWLKMADKYDYNYYGSEIRLLNQAAYSMTTYFNDPKSEWQVEKIANYAYGYFYPVGKEEIIIQQRPLKKEIIINDAYYFIKNKKILIFMQS
jgi:hypothetical protein